MVDDEYDHLTDGDSHQLSRSDGEEDPQVVAETVEELSEPVVPTFWRSTRHKRPPSSNCYLFNHEIGGNAMGMASHSAERGTESPVTYTSACKNEKNLCNSLWHA